MKLKYMLKLHGRSIIFKVLEMDERFRRISENVEENVFRSSNNNMSVISSKIPTIGTENHIFLFGRIKERDSDISVINLPNTEAAKIYFDRIQWTLEEWASLWEGWKDFSHKPMFYEEDNGDSWWEIND